MNVGTHGQFLWQISPELCEGDQKGKHMQEPLAKAKKNGGLPPAA
jgi:hypothetical protein